MAPQAEAGLDSAIDKLKPDDPRAKKTYAQVNGRQWHYLDAHPEGIPRGVVFLIHGFPDFSFGWRYQIPMLTGLGFRCIALDCMGYSGTGSSSDLRDFGFKTHADAVAGIAKHIGAERVVIGGHDWGGMTVYRVAQWYPDLVTHVFSVCTAYAPPMDKYVSTAQLARGIYPQFAYQLQFGSEDATLEREVTGKDGMRRFLNGMFGGKAMSGTPFMTPEKGVDLDLYRNGEIKLTSLLTEEELDYYAAEFSKNGLEGPCNWYRTRHVNWEEELNLPAATRKVLNQPTLHIQAERDNVLLPEMAKGMERSVPNLTRGSVPAGHWALWQTAAATNDIIRNWFENVVIGGQSKL